MSSPTSEPSQGFSSGQRTQRADPQFRPEIDQRLRDNVRISILPHVGTHTLESRYGMEMLVLKVS
jgi:lactate dehydrogenase-like 2-hydroxyacid dehydrogenase